MKIVPLILARGGSKRFPGKNMALFDGEPLVVRAAKQAIRVMGSAVVSSDSQEILQVCHSISGCNVMRRPDFLASDASKSWRSVVQAACRMQLDPSDFVCLLQPTSPLRADADIMACVEAAYRGHSTYTATSGTKHANGAVYMGCVCDWASGWPAVQPDDGYSVITMPPGRSADIDTKEDLEAIQ